MMPEGWTDEAWQEQMHSEVKVAYRLVELGLVNHPDSIPYDSEEVSQIDAEYDEWRAGVERAAAARALEEAADEIFVPHDENRDMSDAFHRGADAVYDALRARAAEIREGKRE